MSETKWTPGPWTARCLNRSTWEVRSDDYGSIVTVHDYPHNAQRLEPDARLIAAAPELYEALELSICPTCGNRIGWNGKPGKTDYRACMTCARARAALAKARSEDVPAGRG